MGQKVTNVISRRGILAGSAGLALAAIAGCSSGSSTSSRSTTSASSGKLEKTDVVVATVPALTNMGLFLAQLNGFFAAEGLHVTIEPIVSSTTAITNQLHGSIDVTAGAYVSYILSQATNPSAFAWQILAEGSISQPGSQQVLVPKTSPVKTIADLKGKTVGANITKNIGTLLIQSVLSEHGVNPSGVNLVAVPFPDMAASLSKGDIAAGWFDEPFLSFAQLKIGARTLFDTCQGATTDFPISGYMVTKAWTEKYPNTAAAFVRAINKGQELADTSRTDCEKASIHFGKGITPEVASVLTFDSYPTGVDVTRLQRVPNVMQQFGLLDKHFDISVMTS